MNLELSSPFMQLNLNVESKRRVIALFIVWMLFWAGIVIGLIYAYVFVLPAWIGFQATVLLGIALIVLSVGNN